eukprot:TCALIF_02189-PA protein Name:"Protein of unknown function" AED:0.05 eAED:0.05 QI:0/1/0.5/1/1/0.5/2/122/215
MDSREPNTREAAAEIKSGILMVGVLCILIGLYHWIITLVWNNMDFENPACPIHGGSLLTWLDATAFLLITTGLQGLAFSGAMGRLSGDRGICCQDICGGFFGKGVFYLLFLVLYLSSIYGIITMGDLVQSEIQMDFPNVRKSYCHPVVVYSSLIAMFALLMAFVVTLGFVLIYLWQALTWTKTRPKKISSSYYLLESRAKGERDDILKDLGFADK